jgi:hypothetical protein
MRGATSVLTLREFFGFGGSEHAGISNSDFDLAFLHASTHLDVLLDSPRYIYLNPP